MEVEETKDVKDEEVEEEEKGQVLQTANVVTSALDVTMPGTLNDERKKV